MIYALVEDPSGAINSVERSDGLIVPFDPSNTDYQAYLEWVAAKNTPTPIPQEPPPTLEQLRELKAGELVEAMKNFIGIRPNSEIRYPDYVLLDLLMTARSLDKAMSNLQEGQEKAAIQARIDIIDSVFAWKDSVRAYGLGIRQKIMESEDPANETWDFSSFNATDPDISLTATS